MVAEGTVFTDAGRMTWGSFLTGMLTFLVGTMTGGGFLTVFRAIEGLLSAASVSFMVGLGAFGGFGLGERGTRPRDLSAASINQWTGV